MFITSKIRKTTYPIESSSRNRFPCGTVRTENFGTVLGYIGKIIMSSFLRLTISAGEISIAVIKKYHDSDNNNKYLTITKDYITIYTK